MTQDLVESNSPQSLVESVVIQGDLAKLAPAERVLYYREVCESLGLNPLTRPFQYITLNGKLVLYASRDATDQLRASRAISVEITAREWLQDAGLYVVTASARLADRKDSSIGAVNVKGLSGEALANALMKAETKAKRRVTLSIAGLGMLDETEVGSIPDAAAAIVDQETGEILPPPQLPVVKDRPPAGQTSSTTPPPRTLGVRKADPWANAAEWQLQAREQLQAWGVKFAEIPAIASYNAPSAKAAMDLFAHDLDEGADPFDSLMAVARPLAQQKEHGEHPEIENA